MQSSYTLHRPYYYTYAAQTSMSPVSKAARRDPKIELDCHIAVSLLSDAHDGNDKMYIYMYVYIKSPMEKM